MESFGDKEIYCAAELGIGLNTKSKCEGICYIEDESTYSTFHIGFGRNIALGGRHERSILISREDLHMCLLYLSR